MNSNSLSAVQGLRRFYAGMRSSQSSKPDPGAWFIEANRVSVASLIKQPSRARYRDERAGPGSVIIVSSLFLVLFTATLLIGGHVALDPLLQAAVGNREANSTGAVVYTMPDGIFCRHMSFDNVTAQQTEDGIARCDGDVTGGRSRTGRAFSWRAN